MDNLPPINSFINPNLLIVQLSVVEVSITEYRHK